MLDVERAFWLTVLAGGIVAALTMLGIASCGFLVRSDRPRFRAPLGGACRPTARGDRSRRSGDNT